MPSPSSELSLFGLDLSAVTQEVSQAWRKVLRLPAMVWLGPSPVVLMHGAQGGASMWRQHSDGRTFVRVRAQADTASSFSAFQSVELPEDMVLRKHLILPPLREPELTRAIELEALSHSPFEPADLAWGHAIAHGTHTSKPIAVELVLTSRRGVARYLAKHGAGEKQPEVWIACADMPERAIGLAGYGETPRRRAIRRGWAVLGLCALLAFALLVGVAVTPTLQLRERALQAVEASDLLVRQSRPQVAKREALLAANEQVRTLQNIIGARLNPLRTMHTLTSVLGDETVLQRLEIEGNKVLLAGQTPDTAALMQKLSAQPGFKGVRAPSAATRPAGATKETFQIEFTIDESPVAANASLEAAQQKGTP